MSHAAFGKGQDLDPPKTLNETLNLINEQPCLTAVAWVARLKIEDLLPIPIIFDEQEKILKDTTNHILMEQAKLLQNNVDNVYME